MNGIPANKNIMSDFVIVAEMHWKLLKEPGIFSRQCKVPLPMRHHLQHCGNRKSKQSETV
ncbi:MAG: hypothetical protein OSJ53_16160 [Kineothrix sp.]|nr:hypothetical protein [Kineothrix sp.]